MVSEHKSDLWDTVDRAMKWIVDFSDGKTQLVSFDQSKTLALLMWNRWILSLFYRYYIGRYSSELVELVPLPYSQGRCTQYSDRLHDSSVTIPRCYKEVYVNSFFARSAKLWILLPIECYPWTYDVSGFKYRIDSHLLTVASF